MLDLFGNYIVGFPTRRLINVVTVVPLIRPIFDNVFFIQLVLTFSVVCLQDRYA